MKTNEKTNSQAAKVYDSLQGEAIFEGTREQCDTYLARLKNAYPRYKYFYVQDDELFIG